MITPCAVCSRMAIPVSSQLVSIARIFMAILYQRIAIVGRYGNVNKKSHVSKTFIANFSILLPIKKQDLPFYNTIAIASDDGLGATFAHKIATNLFKTFLDSWKKDDFEKIKEYLYFDTFYPLLSFKIYDENQKEHDGSMVAVTVSHVLIEKINHSIINSCS